MLLKTRILIATACGITVANLYYCQPLLSLMSKDFACSQLQIGGAFAICLAGYTVGLFFVAPLADIVSCRRLVLILLLSVSAALSVVALSNSLVMLYCSLFALGLSTVVPQVLVPLTAKLTKQESRGTSVGQVMSGLFIGILLSRVLSGFMGEHFGWRSIYWTALELTLILAVVLVPRIPEAVPGTRLSYLELLKSLWTTMRDNKVLKSTSFIAAMNFGAFNACWANLAFLCSGAPFNFTSDMIGLFGLVGAAGALIAPVAGKLSDSRGPLATLGLALLIMLSSFSTMGFFAKQVGGLIAGVFLLDIGSMSCQVSAQTRVYALPPEIHSRINTIYMMSYFIGGSLGAFLGTLAWHKLGWTGVCWTGTAFILLGLLIYMQELACCRQKR